MFRSKSFLSSFSVVGLLLCVPHIAKAETSADNAKKNQKVNATAGGTADQQQNDTESLAATRDVRKAIVADDSLSTYAHNIKIISHGKQLVLKGPVRSEAEKLKVEQIAGKAAPESAITSEIEVTK